METRAAYLAAVDDWAAALDQLVAAAHSEIRTTVEMSLLTEPTDRNPLNQRADEATDAGDVAWEYLMASLETDAEARGQAAAIAFGTLNAAGRLLDAADNPDVVARQNYVLATSDIRLGSWTDELDVFVAAARGIRPVRGGAVDEREVEVKKTIDKVAATGAQELVAIGSNAVVQFGAAQFLDGMDKWFAEGAAAIREVREFITGAWHRLKKAATKIVAWFVEKLLSLVPERLRGTVQQFLKQLSDKIGELLKPANVIAEALELALGADDAAAAWQQVPANRAFDEGVVTEALSRIGWVTTAREKMDGWAAKVIEGLITKVPIAQTAFMVVVAAVCGFVTVEVWDAFHDIANAASAAPSGRPPAASP